MFWNTHSDGSSSNVFIIDCDIAYTFEQTFIIADSMYEKVTSRSVILIESERNFSTVIAYLGALRKRVVPILVDAGSGISAIENLVTSFKVDYIFSTNKDPMANYQYLDSFQGRYLFKRVGDLGGPVNEHLALLMLTSGSTGEPRCVRASYSNLNEVTLSIKRYLDMNSSRVSISSLPFHYSFGLSALNLALASRSTFVMADYSWIDGKFWDLVDRYKISDLSGVPFMFQALRRMKLSDSILANLKCVNQAGGRLEPNLTEYFLNYFASRDVLYFTMYGATEAVPRISYVPPNRALDKLGTVGIPIDIGKLYTDHEDQKSEGELVYEGSNVCLGYAYSREDLVKGDENHQVLRTGDIGFIDDDGFATIVGRIKRFVKVFGVSVNLDSLEAKAKNICSESIVIGEDDNIKVLVIDRLRLADIKQKIMAQVTFSARGLKVISVTEIYLNSSDKPDYSRLSNEFL